jgi:hypothetical protein
MKTRLKLSALLPTFPSELEASLRARFEQAPELIDCKRVVMAEKLAEPVDDDHRQIKILASTRHMDRDNEILFPMGVDFSEFKLSPKILQGHDHSKEWVAKAVTMARNQESVPMTIEFAPTEDGEKHRILSKFAPLSFSVGFIPTDILRPQDAGWGDQVNELIKSWPEFRKAKDAVRGFVREWVLLETSIVNVAANPRALQLSAAKAVEQGGITAKEADICVKGFGADTPIRISSPVVEPPAPEPPPAIRVRSRVSVAEYRPQVTVYAEPMSAGEIRSIVAGAIKETFELMLGRV